MSSNNSGIPRDIPANLQDLSEEELRFIYDNGNGTTNTNQNSDQLITHLEGTHLNSDQRITHQQDAPRPFTMPGIQLTGDAPRLTAEPGIFGGHGAYGSYGTWGTGASRGLDMLLDTSTPGTPESLARLSNNEPCPICREPMNVTVKATASTIPCKHRYHNVCIHRWLDEGNDSCPTCRGYISRLTLEGPQGQTRQWNTLDFLAEGYRQIPASERGVSRLETALGRHQRHG